MKALGKIQSLMGKVRTTAEKSTVLIKGAQALKAAWDFLPLFPAAADGENKSTWLNADLSKRTTCLVMFQSPKRTLAAVHHGR